MTRYFAYSFMRRLAAALPTLFSTHDKSRGRIRRARQVAVSGQHTSRRGYAAHILDGRIFEMKTPAFMEIVLADLQRALQQVIGAGCLENAA